MKKIVLSIVLLVTLLSTQIAYAMETTVYSGTAYSNSYFYARFITNKAGNVVVNSQWIPKNSKAAYIFRVIHYTDPNDVYGSADLSCTHSTYNPEDRPQGNWTCSFSNAPVGYWQAYFKPYNSPTFITITVIAETN